MTEIEEVKATGFKNVIFKVLDDHDSEEMLALCDTDINGVIVNWSLLHDSWLRVLGLVNGLLEYGSSGHQYLTHEGVDDAIVELAFMESQ